MAQSKERVYCLEFQQGSVERGETVICYLEMLDIIRVSWSHKSPEFYRIRFNFIKDFRICCINEAFDDRGLKYKYHEEGSWGYRQGSFSSSAQDSNQINLDL